MKRELPQSLESEQAILGGLMLDDSVLSRVASTLQPSHFYYEKHQRLWRLMVAKANRDEPVEMAAVVEEIARLPTERHSEFGGIAYVAGLPDQVPSTENIEHYARVVVDRSRLRALVFGAQAVIDAVHEGRDLVDVLSAVDALHTAESGQTSLGVLTQVEVMDRVMALLSAAKAAYESGEFPGLWCPEFGFLCRTIKFLPGQGTTVGGPTSSGKTTFAINLVECLAAQGHPGICLLLETEPEIAALKGVSWDSGARYGDLLDGSFSTNDVAAIGESIERRSKLPIIYGERTDITPARLPAYIRQLARVCEQKYGRPPEWLALDYAQVVPREAGETQKNAISELCRVLLTQISRAHHLHYFLVSQVKRDVDSRECSRPIGTDYDGAKELESGQQNNIMIYRPGGMPDKYPEVDSRVMEAIAFKAKGCGPRSFWFNWHGPLQRFEEMPEEHQEGHWRQRWQDLGLHEAAPKTTKTRGPRDWGGAA